MAMSHIDGSPPLPPRSAEAYGKGLPGKPNVSTAAAEPNAAGIAARRGDTAEISAGARQRADLRAAHDAGMEALRDEPPSRADRVAEVRERLAAGYYRSAEVRMRTAEKLMPALDALDRC